MIMKDIRPALRGYLLDDPTLVSLVGDRIHHIRLPQGQVEPSVVYHKITEIGDYSMQGDTGLSHMRIQFDSWAQTADAANQLSNAVHTRLSGVTALMDDVEIQGVFLDNGRDDYDDVALMFRSSRDYIIWYRSDNDGDVFFTTDDSDIFYIAG